MVKTGTATVAQGRRSISTCTDGVDSLAGAARSAAPFARHSSTVRGPGAGLADHTGHAGRADDIYIRVLLGAADDGDIR